MVFLGTHLLFFCRGVILKAYQMEDAMNHDTLQFIAEGIVIKNSIAANAIHGDENISADPVFFFGGMERDDIRVGVVIQVFSVQLLKIAITAKDVIDLAGLLLMLQNNPGDPLRKQRRIVQAKTDVFFKKMYVPERRHGISKERNFAVFPSHHSTSNFRIQVLPSFSSMRKK
jgi:hypothetical protein